MIEGIDGTGKSTACTELVLKLMRAGISTVSYERDLENLNCFNDLKNAVRSSATPDASLLFYLASAIQKSAIIEKALSTSWVVCDRYVYSTLADHTHRGSTVQVAMNTLPIRLPDYAFLLTAPEDIRLTRLRDRGAAADELEPNAPGTRAFDLERLYKEYGLTEIQNSGDVNRLIESIAKHIPELHT